MKGRNTECVFGESSDQFKSISLRRGRKLCQQSNLLPGYPSLLSRYMLCIINEINIQLSSMPFGQTADNQWIARLSG